MQIENNLFASKDIEDNNFTIEMETGTGKTYVYLRSILELNKEYGFTKFMIVVPTVAIRTGVEKSIKMLKEHFKILYGIDQQHTERENPRDPADIQPHVMAVELIGPAAQRVLEQFAQSDPKDLEAKRI